MEETTEKEIPRTEKTDLDGGDVGIRRRLRDRDLLRKRKAEAEERATNQAQNTRKRERREERSTSGRRGRPRKNIPPPEAPVPQEAIASVIVPDAGMISSSIIQVKAPETMEPKMATPITFPDPAVIVEAQPVLAPSPVAVPAPSFLSASTVDQVSETVPAPAAIPLQLYRPAPVSAPAPAPVPAYSPAIIVGSGSADEVLIEDLGPDEEEDLPPLQGNLIIDQEAREDPVEDPPVDVPDQNRMFSYPLFASLPLQK